MKNHYQKILYAIAIQLLCMASFSQNPDSIRLVGPRIMISNPETGKQMPLRLDKFELKVEVVDNVAVTTMDMTFFNDLNRQLEGELVFPLAEGQTVSRFAMEIKGKLREGVVVEKQKGQKVFEAIVRRRIDPALLEWTPGNNFKARIFPIPAKGTKRIVIAYEQELKTEDNAYVYKIPLEFSSAINLFLINFRVFNTKNLPIVKSTAWDQLKFNKDIVSYKAELAKDNYHAQDDLEISIPVSAGNNFVYAQAGKVDEKSFFYINICKPLLSMPKKLPEDLCIYWDASGSGTSRDTSKELLLLENYLKKCNNMHTKLILFSNEVDTIMDFEIINGNCTGLLDAIKNTFYDGGTQLGTLDFNLFPCDEILLFSDGISNFGKSEITLSKTPVTAINSSNTAEHSYLNYMANRTSGAYINLAKLNNGEAIELLSNNCLRFISAEYNTNDIEDVYPSMPVICNGNVTFAGITKKPGAAITLNFGYGNTITSSEVISIPQDSLPTNGIVERIWAQKKIKDLQVDFKNNDAEITQTGKKYSIVTHNTSLIVLDSIRDYVLYEILPPVEMQEQYFALLKQKKVQAEENFSTKIGRLLQNYQQKTQWWSGLSRYDEIKTSTNSGTATFTNPAITDTFNHANSPTAPVNTAANQTTTRTIPGNQAGGITVTGRIVDMETGTPIPFAAIVTSDNTSGTTSDIDGNFSINVTPNSRINISYIGYSTATVSVTAPSNIEIPLRPANIELSAFEVIDYSQPLISRDATSSISTFSSEIEKMPGRSVNDIISTVGGVYADENGSDINFRGARSDANAVFIDGVRVAGMQSIPKSAISEITVYTGGIPAQFGDVTGGVIDIKTNGYNNTYFHEDIIMNSHEDSYGYPDKKNYPSPEPSPWARKLDSVPKADIYLLYCALKPEYISSSAFYAEFADACLKAGQCKTALKILSNLAEIELQNHELSRILARKLQQFGEKEYAILKYRDILKLRPEEPHSYRDLGLSLYENGQYQEAVDMLYTVLTKDWDSRFPGIESVVIGELSAIISSVGEKIDLSKIDGSILR
ncbi:MAG TPA: VIT domain-containing protein [Bacteroidales bacterium]|nr:VIT domain-containing protein [Bacteroidales bacterium]